MSQSDVQNGVYDGISDIISRYNGGAAVQSVFFQRLADMGSDADVITALQNNNAVQSVWDSYYAAPTDKYVGQAIKDAFLDFLADDLLLSSGMKKSVKLFSNATTTLEKAFVDVLDDGPVKAYVEKVTGKIVTSAQALSDTTHIPYGKYASTAVKGIQAFAVYEALKDTVTSAWEASTGSGDVFAPLHNYLVAGGSIVAGAASAVFFLVLLLLQLELLLSLQVPHGLLTP